jgi:hypothetical protein
MSHTLLSAILLVVIFLWPRAALAQGVSPQAIVDSLYPAARLHPESAAARRSCYRIAGGCGWHTDATCRGVHRHGGGGAPSA